MPPTTVPARRRSSCTRAPWGPGPAAWLALCAALVLVAVPLARPDAVAAARPAATTPGPSGGATGLQTEYDGVLAEEAQLEARIAGQAKLRKDIDAKITELQSQLGTVSTQLDAANARLDQAASLERAARTALEQAAARVSRSRAALEAQAVGAYMEGGDAPPAVQALLNGDAGTTKAQRTVSYANAVLDHQHQVVEEYRAARTARDQAARRARSSRQGAATIRDAIVAAKHDLQVKRVQVAVLQNEAAQASWFQHVALSELQSKRIAIEASITQLEKASDNIALVLASAQAHQPDYTPGSIAFSVPIPGAHISSPFGMRFHPILHYVRLHAGADLGAASGTPIHAAADGVVLLAGPEGGYGNATVIDHGNSIATVYAHQSQIGVRVGQRVKRGDVIGYVGATGLATGPHLHFETRVRGTPVNPTSLIDFGAGGAPGSTASGD